MALSFCPDLTRAMYTLAVLYASDNDLEHALVLLHKMAGLKPDDPEVNYNIACIYSRQGKVSEALRQLSHALEKGFNKWEILRKDPDLENIRETQYYKSLMTGGNQ